MHQHLEGLINPDTSLRMVSLVCLAKWMPILLSPDSTIFLATFGSVGKALSPMTQFASIVKCSNLTSTVGSRIPTLQITNTKGGQGKDTEQLGFGQRRKLERTTY
ncbi:hypothetical protein LINGRAHAP2_LOCUS7458 [Linum grandiflorum]